MTPQQFATHWHGSQVRKYTGEPYIEHCREIVEILKGVPHNEDMLAAAWSLSFMLVPLVSYW